MKIKRPERMEELIKMYSGRKDLKDQMEMSFLHCLTENGKI